MGSDQTSAFCLDFAITWHEPWDGENVKMKRKRNLLKEPSWLAFATVLLAMLVAAE